MENKTKKTTMGIIIGIISMISFASAIYPGECDTFEFPVEGIANYTVQDNISSMEGFSFTQNGTNITYCISGDASPNSFILTFYVVESEPEIVIEYHYSGGGGGGSRKTVYVEKEVVSEFDANGCLVAKGFFYCENRNMCVNNNNDCPSDKEIIIKEEDKDEESKKNNLWFLLLIPIFLLFMYIYYKFFKKGDENEEIKETP